MSDVKLDADEHGSDRVDPERRLADLTAVQRDILWALSRLERPKGLAVKAVLDEYYPTPVTHGWLYPNLDAVVERGLAGKGQRDGRTNEYWLTPAGRRALKRHRAWTRSDDWRGRLPD